MNFFPNYLSQFYGKDFPTGCRALFLFLWVRITIIKNDEWLFCSICNCIGADAIHTIQFQINIWTEQLLRKIFPECITPARKKSNFILFCLNRCSRKFHSKLILNQYPIFLYISQICEISVSDALLALSLIHIWRCRRSTLCRSRWSPYH